MITLFSMAAQGSNKIHQKAKTLHIKYTNSKGYMNRNKTKYNIIIQVKDTLPQDTFCLKIERLAGSVFFLAVTGRLLKETTPLDINFLSSDLFLHEI